MGNGAGCEQPSGADDLGVVALSWPTVRVAAAWPFKSNDCSMCSLTSAREAGCARKFEAPRRAQNILQHAGRIN